MIPDTTYEAILKAMELFDRTLRESAEWSDWKQKENYRFAIDYNGRQYPVKKIISLATGITTSSFSGGDEANGYLKKKGFSVVQLRYKEGEKMGAEDLKKSLEFILSEYTGARATGSFGKQHPVWSEFDRLKIIFENSNDVKKHPNIKVNWSAGQGNWAKIPWIAFLDNRETNSTQRGVYCVFLFRQDMSGVYLTFNQGVTETKIQLGQSEARKHLHSQADSIRNQCGELEQQGYKLDNKIDLRTDSGLGVDYEYSTIAYKLYEKGAIPNDKDITDDLEAVLQAYENYVNSKINRSTQNEQGQVSEKLIAKETSPPMFDPEVAITDLVKSITGYGFVFEPWQVATFVTAIRTKPFVILAGVSGTGKSKLPALVARATGGEDFLLPVRPDWTDSSDVLGYTDLQGNFRPGPLLEYAGRAGGQRDKYFMCIIDEMNLARVEHYFAEVLSRIEDRRLSPQGGYKSGPLLSHMLQDADAAWAAQGLPANLAIVGTVNMDESTHGFSRKVLDRAFTIELSDIDLDAWEPVNNSDLKISPWPVQAWYPRAVQLGGLDTSNTVVREIVENVIRTLTEINSFLVKAQLQVGYRTRDEIVLFVLHAREVLSSFVTRTGENVDPLDLALQMKVLPRIVGGSSSIQRTVLHFLGWAYNGKLFLTDDEAIPVLESWESSGRPGASPGARFPRTAARLCLMWDRLRNEGFTSFWL